MLPRLILVVSPLIALMKDQIDSLLDSGIPAGRLDSTMSHPERSETYDRLRARHLKLLYVSPERLLMQGFLDFLKERSISSVAIDEANCVSMWGHDFARNTCGLRIHEITWRRASDTTLDSASASRTKQILSVKAVHQLSVRAAVLQMTNKRKPGWARGIWSRLVMSVENPPNNILVDYNIENQRNLLSNPRTTPCRITLLHLDNCSNDLMAGSLWTGLLP